MTVMMLLADSMTVLGILLVVGVMDDARADILGGGNIQKSLVESVSQVTTHCLTILPLACVVSHTVKGTSRAVILTIALYDNTCAYRRRFTVSSCPSW